MVFKTSHCTFIGTETLTQESIIVYIYILHIFELSRSCENALSTFDRGKIHVKTFELKVEMSSNVKILLNLILGEEEDNNRQNFTQSFSTSTELLNY